MSKSRVARDPLLYGAVCELVSRFTDRYAAITPYIQVPSSDH